MKHGLANRLLTEEEVAQWLRCSKYTVRREVAAGRLRSTKVGVKSRFTHEMIFQYLSEQEKDKCEGKMKVPTQAKLETIGSRNAQTARYGVEHGLTPTPDRHAAHHLAKQIFGAPK